VQARGTGTGEEDGAGGVAVGPGGSKRAKALSIAPSRCSIVLAMLLPLAGAPQNAILISIVT